MKPEIFIGSSVEGKDVADAIQLGLQRDAYTKVWHQAFPLGQTTIDTLFCRVSMNDFAVFVFSPDDQLHLRQAQYEVARDNVIFEAGLFMGAQGRDRTFIVAPMGNPAFHIPTDLLGITTASYDADHAKQDVNAALGPVVTQIRQAISKTINFHEIASIKSYVTFVSSATWPLKVMMNLHNLQTYPLLLESVSFEQLRVAPLALNTEYDGSRFVPKFNVGTDGGEDVTDRFCILRPDKRVLTWVPFNTDIKEADLRDLLKAGNVGTWKYRIKKLSGPAYERGFQAKIAEQNIFAA